MNTNPNKEHCIDGITCMVDSCGYHSAANRCTAKNIKINGSHANNKTDTLCQTFEKD